MDRAWTAEDFLDYHYSRMAVRRVMRQSGISDKRYIGGLERRAQREAENLKYSPPELQIEGNRLIPVVIHNAWD